MGFLGLVMAYSLRLSLSVAITQMVPPPIFSTANLTNAHGEIEIVCPFNDSNYIHEHFDYVAIFDSLYSVKKSNFYQFYYYYCYCWLFSDTLSLPKLQKRKKKLERIIEFKFGMARYIMKSVSIIWYLVQIFNYCI